MKELLTGAAARPRLLLHVCCGPCAAHCAEALSADFNVTLFFSNSNISPPEEYAWRLEQARKLASCCSLPLVEDAYDHEGWLNWIAGLESEPERGGRCERCFEFSLRRAGEHARQAGFDGFTTTLTVSPHKDSPTLFRVGARLGGFHAMDFKKKDGFRRSMELAKRHGLERQDYCGCEFSRSGSSGRQETDHG